jgi:hypothetical protein
MFDISTFALWIAVWAAGSIAVSGIVQSIKDGLPKTWAVPAWVWTALAPACSVGVGYSAAYGSGTPTNWLWYGLGIWGFAKLFYEKLFKVVEKKIEG